MPRHYNDAKLGLGEPWASKIDDFLVASHRGTFLELVRRAVDAYIKDYADKNPGFKEDFEKARAAREAEEKG